MRFMAIMKATANSEAGILPDEKMLSEMGKFNQELVDAGIMLAGEGLQPSSKGSRLNFGKGTCVVTDGPFAEVKELIAGYWMLKAQSKVEVVNWLKRCPNPHAEEFEIEVRQVFEPEDFGEEFTPELREAEEKLRDRISAGGSR